LDAACPELTLPARNEGLKSLLFPAGSPGGLGVLGREQAATEATHKGQLARVQEAR